MNRRLPVIGLVLLCALAVWLWTQRAEPERPRAEEPVGASKDEGERVPLLESSPFRPATAQAVVYGRVVDEEGTPVPDVVIRVDGAGSTSCDQEARFEIEGLTVGVHEFQAARGAKALGKPVSVRVESGAGRYEIELVVPHVRTISGHVIDRHGDAVSGVGVTFKRSSGAGIGHSAMTAEDGGFRVVVPESGSYLAEVAEQRVDGTFEAGQEGIILRLPDLSGMRIRIVDGRGVLVPRATLRVTTTAPMRGNTMKRKVIGGVHVEDVSQWDERTDLHVVDPCDEDGEPLPLCWRVVEGVDRTLPELTIELTEGRPLAGTTVDEDGNAVPKVYVTVTDPDATGRNHEVGFAVSGKDGHFVIPAIPKKDLLVAPSAPRGPWVEVHPIALPVDQSEITIRLRRSEVYRVTVLNSSGEEISGATVHVSWVNGGKYAFRRKPTDEHGVAVLEGVSQTLPLVVDVLTDGLKPPLPAFQRKGVRFVDGPLVVRLGSDAVIAGRVVNADGKPVKAGTVVAEGADGETLDLTARATVNSEDGSFTVHVAPGAYRVWIEECPGCSTNEPIAVTAPMRSLRIDAPRWDTARGILHVKEPQAWRIEWFVAPRALEARIGPEGHFEIGGVRKGTASLLATRAGDERVALLEGVDPLAGPIEVRPAKGMRVEGRIVGYHGEEPGKPYVKLTRGLVCMYAKVRDDMTFSATNVPPGTWRLELRQGFKEIATMDRVAAGTTGVVLEVDR